MSQTRGRPQISVRLHPAALEKLKQKVSGTEPGRKSGLAAYVRDLIYADIGFDSGEYQAVEEVATEGR